MPAPASPTLVRRYLKSRSCSTLSARLLFRPARRDREATLAAVCDRATRRTVRVLDRNDSHRFWIQAVSFTLTTRRLIVQRPYQAISRSNHARMQRLSGPQPFKAARFLLRLAKESCAGRSEERR